MQAEGGTIDPVVALLLKVRADREDGEPEAPASRMPPPDFVCPPPGFNSAPWPASSLQEKPLASDEAPGNLPQASAAPAPASVAKDRPASPAPESQPRPSVAEPQPAAPAPSAAPPRKPSGFPGFDAYSDLRAKERRDEEERAKKVEAARAQGRCQISATESFPPDPREGPEIVNFTTVPGGRGIRRGG